MAYIKHEDLCGAFKGKYFRGSMVIDIFLWHSHWQSQTQFPSLVTCLSFLRWHTPCDPCSHWHTTRGPHTRSCKLCVWFVHFVGSLGPATALSHVSDWVYVFLSRSSTDRGNTRSVSRVHLDPLRFCLSIRTHPAPLPLFCPSLLQMTSFKASQRRHLPLIRPLLPPRSTQISAFSMQLALSPYSSVYCKRLDDKTAFFIETLKNIRKRHWSQDNNIFSVPYFLYSQRKDFPLFSFLRLSTFQVSKAATSTKPGPATTSAPAANQTASVTGTNECSVSSNMAHFYSTVDLSNCSREVQVL